MDSVGNDPNDCPCCGKPYGSRAYASDCSGAGCDGGYDRLGCYGKSAGLVGYGIIQPSDSRCDDFISPMTNPVFFEDPRSLTEVRCFFINYNLPGALGATRFKPRLLN